ncbi:14218_t:CDS:2 [Dentiscutata erythropus]|uniref:14218_t:CDS:1 n=1 Tax=Dentiscutata erythropus TaxID=1348616 RepID=A0A9N9DGD9_9GLOM|nr:14218_t:CDS:2 [Dentiscutata erythropus]
MPPEQRIFWNCQDQPNKKIKIADNLQAKSERLLKNRKLSISQ